MDQADTRLLALMLEPREQDGGTLKNHGWLRPSESQVVSLTFTRPGLMAVMEEGLVLQKLWRFPLNDPPLLP